jgi:DNA repair protein RecO
MSHHIYTTPGYIVHSASHGEAGKFFLVFTRDLGMIGATAQGVRLSQSKLRYYVQDFSYGLFSLVRGKEVWRMTGAKEIEGVGEVHEENKKLYVRVLSLLKRLLPGEEKNERLFEVMNNFYNYLNKEVREKELVEYTTVLRILNHLGYISNKDNLDGVLSNSLLNKEVLDFVKVNKKPILEAINNALKESQL